MKRTIITETWPRMKRIINTRKCEPDAAAAVVVPAGFWIASVGSSLMVIPPFQADWPPLAGEMPWDLAGGILQRGRRWEWTGKPHRPSEGQTWLKTQIQCITQPVQ